MKLDALFQSSWLRRLFLAVAGMLSLWAMAWLALPLVLKNQLESRLSEQFGRTVSVGRVDFKPWSLELTLGDLAVAHADAANPSAQFSVKRLYVDIEAQSLWRLAPVVDALQIEAPRLLLKHLGGGHYDVDDVLARLRQTPATPEAQQLRFALYNLALTQGEVALEDASLGKVHQLTGLTIKLPFLSSLQAKREVQVQPQLAFALNGSQFDTAAQSTPFADNRKTEAHVKLKDLDLAPYLAYLPASLPLRLTSAVLNADLKLAFEQAGQISVVLSGLVTASHVKIAAPQSGSESAPTQAVMAFDSLQVQLADVRPLERKVQLGRVEWVKPQLDVSRNEQGVINWQTFLGAPKSSKKASENIAYSADSTGATAKKDKNSLPWTVGVAHFSLQGGKLRWSDRSTPMPASLAAHAINFSAQALTWPVTQRVPFEGSAETETATLTFSGGGTDQAADLTAKLESAPLILVAPYLADVLVPQLNGLLGVDLGVTWLAQGPAQQPMQLAIQVPKLTLDQVELGPAPAPRTGQGGKATLASIRQLQVEQVSVDVPRQTATLGKVLLTQPKAALARRADGRWMFEDWFRANASAVPAAAADGSVSTKSAARANRNTQKPWVLVVNDLSMTKGDFGVTDEVPHKPVAFDLSAMSLQLKNFSSESGKPFSWSLGARMQHGQTEPGSLAGRGTVVMSPLSLQGDLNLQRLPLHALEPYMADALNIELLRADASFKGHVAYAQNPDGMALQVRGDTRLEDLRADTLAQTAPYKPAEELLNWKDLSLTGLNVAMVPGSVTRVDVAQTTLSDFYAKLTLSETGRLNLQDVVATGSNSAASATGTVVAPTAAPASAPNPADHSPLPPTAVLAQSPASLTDESKSIATSEGDVRATGKIDIKNERTPVIYFGPVSLNGGRVDFTDRFIKPNYSARLTELAGKLGAFSSQANNGEVQLADLELRGRAEGTATLEIVGKVNPLAKPLALDIQGHVRDLELAPLSAYSIRHAGHGIERGKLSVDVAYKVQPDGQLTASNNIVLNQLKFGDQVPGASSSLPVKLAVALLADRNGVIDINLPISGSLNDPQFRLAPIVFKLIVNLIAKAITAPFSLLVSAFGGGGDELSMVSFAPGSAALTPEAIAGLDKVAKALQARPALKMTVVGTASLELERNAFKREQLHALVLAEKRRAQPGGATTGTVQVSADEYQSLLKAVYKRADFPKPRNLIGMAKDLPVPDMEVLLLTNLSATESAMQALAVRRGVVVRDHLASLQLPLERLFLGAAKAVPPEAKWQPRAELSLASE